MGFKFQNITCKLGNMRAAQRFTVYPIKDPNLILIQSDKRIAQVNMTTGKAMLSDGKGGHQGFHKLHPMLGGKEVDVPADVLDALKPLIANMQQQQNADGSVTLCDGG